MVSEFTPRIRIETADTSQRTANVSPRPNNEETSIRPSSVRLSRAEYGAGPTVLSVAGNPERLQAPRSEQAEQTPVYVTNSGGGAQEDSEQGGVPDAGAPLRIRNFRFLAAAQSARERELESRHDQLERRLESVTSRLALADSLMVQIDARLKRARLERDLDMITSQMRRLRLESAFQTSPAANQVTDTSGTEFSGAVRVSPPISAQNPNPSDSATIFNLLA